MAVSAVPFDRSSGIQKELGPHSTSRSCIMQRLNRILEKHSRLPKLPKVVQHRYNRSEN